MQEEQEEPDPQPDPQPDPTDPASTFSAGEDAEAAKAAKAKKKKKADQRKAQRAKKADEAGRPPHQAGHPRGPQNLREEEHEARLDLHCQQHDLDRDRDFVTITAEYYSLLKHFAMTSLPKDFASEIESVFTIVDAEGDVYDMTELKRLLARLVLGVSASGDDEEFQLALEVSLTYLLTLLTLHIHMHMHMHRHMHRHMHKHKHRRMHMHMPAHAQARLHINAQWLLS